MTGKDQARQGRREFLRIAGAVAGVIALGPLAHLARAADTAGAPLKIGIIGSGRVGSALGELWLKAGHAVMFSSRNLENDKALAARLGGRASAGTPLEAAKYGDVMLISIPYAGLPQLGRDLGELIKGKVILDTCDPIPSRDGEMAVQAREKGAGLASAEYLPGARIVRAFNAVGAARLPEAQKHPGSTAMPIAGDDADAIALATRLVRETGFEPVVIGSLAMGKYLIPGSPLGGEHTPAEIRQILSTLK